MLSIRPLHLPAASLLLALAGCGGDDLAGCQRERLSAPGRALEQCDRALENRLVWGERRANALVDRAAIRADRREWDRAIADLSAAIDSGKLSAANLVVAYYDRGSAFGQKGEHAAAIAELSEALRLDPRYADAYVNRAASRRERNDAEGALADANAALKLQPSHPRALLQRALAQLALRENDQALADATQAVKLEPDLGPGHFLRGMLLAMRGDAEGAIAAFGETLRLEPGNLAALQRRSSLHESRKEYDRALADLATAEKLMPPNATLVHDRALILARKGDLDGALGEAGRALAIDPKMADAYNTRGWIRLQKKDYDAAIADLGRALALNPAQLLALGNRATACLAKKDYGCAVADMEALAGLDPRGAQHRSIGILRYYLGQYPESAAAMSRALQAKPDDHYAVLWRFLAQSREGKAAEARAGLAEGARGLPIGKWPSAAVDFYLGKATEAALFKAAADPDPATRASQACEANYYAGALKLLRGDRAKALPQLRAAEKDCPRDFAEYDGAVVELARAVK